MFASNHHGVSFGMVASSKLVRLRGKRPLHLSPEPGLDRMADFIRSSVNLCYQLHALLG